MIWEAKELNKLAHLNDASINYIPAHTGQKGNEIAGILAKMGAKKTGYLNSSTYTTGYQESIQKVN